MKALHAALITKGSERAVHRDIRPLGWWSYQVPEFLWSHLRVPNGMTLDVGQLAARLGFDLFVQEDWSGIVRYTNKTVPLVFMSYDDTLDKSHLDGRVRASLKADLCLVDHGPLRPFKVKDGRPVKRLAHAVNDHLFKPVPEKLVDVVFHCSTGRIGATERSNLQTLLSTECKRLGLSYRSGGIPVEEYSRSMAEARVVVNLPRTGTNRPHRVFDSMACRACLLTAPIPAVEGDGLVAGVHYASWDGEDATLPGWLEALVQGGQWEHYADAGYEHVVANHTWTVRAKQFRALLNEEFGI